MKPPLFLIGGPTASGKTAYALDLAKREGGTILNADAMQVYRDLPLLTAQPTAEEKSQAPHALFEIFDPAERGSVGLWFTRVQEALAPLAKAGQTPILVGGTGLYFRALEGGLADIPAIDPEIRDEAQALYASLGEAAFREKLRAHDPQSAAKIKPNDRQRLIRAFEVVRGTGRPLGFWHEQAASASLLSRYAVQRILILPDRAKLYARCDARFLGMMANGAEEEVRALLARGLDPDLPAMKILGVPELAAAFKGSLSRDEAIAKAQQATRNYAKRQVTWFKNQWKETEGERLSVLTP